MSPATQPPQVEIHDVAIDHVNVREGHGGVKSLRAILPFLTVLIAATSATFSFGFKVVQDHYAKLDRQAEEHQKAEDKMVARRQKADDAWRDALAKSLGSGQSAALLALEMQTFAEDAIYGNQAKAIMYQSLTRIESEVEFDAAFNGALHSTLEEDQDALVAVVQKLSLQLEHKCDEAMRKAAGTCKANQSLAAFVQNPEAYFRSTDPALAETHALMWKLETASGGLSSLWRGSKTRRALRPGESVDLTGVIFLGNDFRGVDFSRVSAMNDTVFLGSCRVDRAVVQKGATDGCEKG